MPSGYQKVSYSDPLAIGNKDEVWLVQVPNTVDIGDAKVVSENEIVVGNTTYALRATEMPVGDCEVLIPDAHSVLRPTKTRPSKLMALAKRVGLPKTDYDQVREPKPRVEQVKNMRMRHFPTGYSAKTFGIATDVESPRKVKSEKHKSKDKQKSKDKHKSKDKSKKKKD